MKQTSDEKHTVGAPKVPKELIQRIVETIEELENGESETQSRTGRKVAGGEKR